MIAIGAWGWAHAAWLGGFYPEDLPPEWRLTFYSNEFDAVGLDADAWLAPDIETLRGWVGDTREGFRFFLGLSGQLPDDLEERLTVLAPRLGAVLVDAALPSEVFDQVRRFAPLWGDGPIPGLATVAQGLSAALELERAPLVMLDDETLNLRAARTVMDILGRRGHATILLRGHASLARLEELRTLRDLLGWH